MSTAETGALGFSWVFRVRSRGVLYGGKLRFKSTKSKWIMKTLELPAKPGIRRDVHIYLGFGVVAQEFERSGLASGIQLFAEFYIFLERVVIYRDGVFSFPFDGPWIEINSIL